MRTQRLIVRALDDSVPAIRTVTVAHPEGRTLPSYPPGSHITVRCGNVTNAYSLTGDGLMPTEYVFSVLELPAGAGGSRWMHHNVNVGDELEIGNARSLFAPILRARRHLLIAAGIGVTPLVSHLRAARRWNRPVELLYAYRPGQGAYVDEVADLTDGQVQTFHDRTSFAHALAARLAQQPIGTHLYVCGPSGFMDYVVGSASRLGWPASRVHQETFGVAALDPGTAFEVAVTSGDRFTVPAGVSLLEALEGRGHSVPNQCRQGVCGECRIPVLNGAIHHRDLYLTEDEKAAHNTIMCCVSRARGTRIEVVI